MRRFLGVSLVVVTGCGDNLGPSVDTDDHGAGNGGVTTTGEVLNKLLPEVCAAHAWPDVFVEDKDMQLRAIPTQQGAAVLGVPRGGGALWGFVVDSRGLIVSDPAGTKILPGTFTGVSATQHEGRLFAAVVGGTTTQMLMLREDLGGTDLLATYTGATIIGETTMIGTRLGPLAAVGGADGVVASFFDRDWAPLDATSITTDVPVSLTAIPYGSADAMIAWSTGTSCNLARPMANAFDTQDFACPNGRVAADHEAKAGHLVFERGETLVRSDIRIGAHNDIANDNQLVPHGRSPRIVFDGARYWVSYINFHGDLNVGFLDDDGSLTSMALEGVRPMTGAHDLAVIDGEVWVYAVDGDNGFNASQLCLTREGL